MGNNCIWQPEQQRDGNMSASEDAGVDGRLWHLWVRAGRPWRFTGLYFLDVLE